MTLSAPHEVTTGLLEPLIRSYDCATQFLRVRIEEESA